MDFSSLKQQQDWAALKRLIQIARRDTGQARPQQPQKHGSRGWMVVTVAVLLVFAIPAYLTQIRNDSEQVASVLNWLWVAICLFLVFKSFGLVRRFFARSSARSTALRQTKEEAEPVTWLVGRASSSPSRAEAQRNLPEYVARLG